MHFYCNSACITHTHRHQRDIALNCSEQEQVISEVTSWEVERSSKARTSQGCLLANEVTFPTLFFIKAVTQGQECELLKVISLLGRCVSPVIAKSILAYTHYHLWKAEEEVPPPLQGHNSKSVHLVHLSKLSPTASEWGKAGLCLWLLDQSFRANRIKNIRFNRNAALPANVNPSLSPTGAYATVPKWEDCLPFASP